MEHTMGYRSPSHSIPQGGVIPHFVFKWVITTKAQIQVSKATNTADIVINNDKFYTVEPIK